jgi:DNA-binding CsgD family transcriptional regulator
VGGTVLATGDGTRGCGPVGFRLLVAGRSNPELADALSISPRTASTHVEHILAKLGVATRTEAAARAVRDGLV